MVQADINGVGNAVGNFPAYDAKGEEDAAEKKKFEEIKQFSFHFYTSCNNNADNSLQYFA